MQEKSRGECEGQETCLIPLVWRQQGVQQHGLVVRESPWKNPFMHGTFGATPWKVPGLSFIESKLVDDDIGGNWSSKCSCHKYSISIRLKCMIFSSLCWKKTQHPTKVDKFFERSVGARRGCDFVEKDGCSRVSSGNEQSLHLRVHRGTLSGLETRR